jgi:hypothetical protein
LNFIFGIVCLFVCVCAFSLRRESSDMILGDKPLISEVVLSHPSSMFLSIDGWSSRISSSGTSQGALLMIFTLMVDAPGSLSAPARGPAVDVS